jgi:hypothetical protein
MWGHHPDEVRDIPAADAECVERVRRLVARYDRWRPALVALYGGLLIAFVAAVAVLVEELKRDGFWPALGPGFAGGLALGAFVGLNAVMLGHRLAGVLSRGWRHDRLLVRYYDALRQAGPGR